MKTKIFIFISLFLSIFASFSVAAEQTDYERALQCYKSGDFANATSIYESLINQDKESADIYYNLGNCYYRMSDFSHAILYYEKALLIDPGMTDARENLIIANSKKKDKIDSVGTFFLSRLLSKVANIGSSDFWAVVSIIIFSLFLVLVLVYLFINVLSLRKVGFYGAGVLFLLFIASVFFSKYQKDKLINRDYAIIMSPSVTLKSTPDNDGTALLVVHDGVKVKINEQLDDWIEVTLPNGSVGWMLKSDVERI